MMYVLALLDCHNWPDAVACYEKSRKFPRNTWNLPRSNIERAWPNLKFSVDTPDYAGMRAYAHLVLGTESPLFMDEKHQLQYMLGQLSQLLKTNPDSYDAALASGCLYTQQWHFTEARAAFAYAARLATPAQGMEIKAALEELKDTEERKQQYDARVAASQEKPK